MSSRYVILHHVGIQQPHFDLLFEMSPGAAALTTFRCPRWPLVLGDELVELPQHRRAYLEYEGVISGDRGSVSRVDAGTVEVAELAVDPPTLGLRLRSDRGSVIELTLTHRFAADARSLWTLTTLSA